MFDKELIGCYLDAVTHRLAKLKGDEHKITDMQLRIQPFTRELCGELDEQVKGILFTRTDGEVASKVQKVYLKLPIKPQQVAFRSAPDLPKAAFIIDEAKVSGLYARKSAKSNGWVLVFTLSVVAPSKDELALIVDGHHKQHWLTFANARPGLFDAEDKDRRTKRAASPGA